MAIHLFQKININNSTQYVLIKGKTENAPLLIHVQAGPGLPMISEAGEMQKLLHLEDHFLVCYWDQRACGLSYHPHTDPTTISLNQMAEDIISCTQFLLKKYLQSKAIIIGYSIGATTSLLAAGKDSSLFSAVFAVAPDIDIPYANTYAIAYLKNKAESTGNKKLLHEVKSLESTPVTESKSFQRRARLLTNAGGITTTGNYNKLVFNSIIHMLFSRYYGIYGLLKTLNGMKFCQDALLPEMNSFNLFDYAQTVNVPIHFFQGALDGIASIITCREFYHKLPSAGKSFTVFEKSAHMPHLDEPEKFSTLILSLS